MSWIIIDNSLTSSKKYVIIIKQQYHIKYKNKINEENVKICIISYCFHDICAVFDRICIC